MQKPLAWATDIHLDHCDANVIAEFATQIRATGAQVLCLTGDLAESQNLVDYLHSLAEMIQMPIYFVLGNHDYYHGSIASVRKTLADLQIPALHWLPHTGPVELGAKVCLIGHDGWSDGQHGDFSRSTIRLKDYRLIEELAQAGQAGLLAQLQALGAESAAWFRARLPEVLAHYQQVYLLMHPPPFREACLYGTEIADDNWAPHFICKAVGDLLLELMPQFPQTQLTVLAGHTHNPCDIQILANLRVQVGKAEYGAPALAGLFDIF
ncbi:phosphoesterase [bacterium (Candidatus Blackallbacteria) CG17_big_fil_post_rev_8_21_14_2_50_48_46]|uniref:Phosphoesterase n=1 Tax=bacterium (Candidatus Blackallbacteria) CG17_big_fil_post_rev_8_21_14_2_50_48_46 TaxID=2014261 RepID=A0A2M7FYV4_9BACT|nr:MAG: phosphoesterase [bacterium (Candidatus Blackallbacteria) CG18_big_fil_WC_8_21_14_2_50_49_26]PIW14384.1 MAG: phosphoesterase [bacterium (Candidatus Blackallbacteria) CG17_big_fil_post_rev_8_21_14_2_50_48_46]PIW46891.1 MAG: phosphoesterase [bacterium (Candidatus Blackallbacteria) CG13_big_fil_rev_8_21_14_2_50_49_14]